MRLVFLLYTIHVYIHAAHYKAAFRTKGNASTLVTVDECAKLLPDCAKLCVKHDCLSFGYNQDRNTCWIYSGVLVTATENEAHGFRFFRKEIDFQEKAIALYNLATRTRMSVYGQDIFDVTKKNSQNYVFIRCGPASSNAVHVTDDIYGCFNKDDIFLDQQWILTENIDGTLTFRNAYTLKCLSLEGSTIKGRDCSPYSPYNSWVIQFL